MHKIARQDEKQRHMERKTYRDNSIRNMRGSHGLRLYSAMTQNYAKNCQPFCYIKITYTRIDHSSTSGEEFTTHMTPPIRIEPSLLSIPL